MKTRVACPFYIGIYVLVLVLAGFVLSCTLGVVTEYGIAAQPAAFFMIVMSGVGFVTIVYQLIFDPLTALISAGPNGISVYIKMKRYRFCWDDFVDFNIEPVSLAAQSMKLAYFSTRPIRAKEKETLLQRTRRDVKHVVLFECSGHFLQDVLEYAPEHIAETMYERMRQLGLRRTGK